MPRPTPEQQFVKSLVSRTSLSQERKLQLLNLVLAEGLSTRVIRLAQELGLWVPVEELEILPPQEILAFSLPPIRVFNYLSENEAFCFHFILEEKGVYGTIFIGPHVATAQCIAVDFSRAKEIALHYLHGNAFGLVINQYPIKEIQVFESGLVKALCYGFEREYILQKGH